jgi:tetratricopeptide (TPR) repeat protein
LTPGLKTRAAALLAGGLLLFLTSTPFAGEIPTAGLRAEHEQRWDDAIGAYSEALAQNPGRADLWLRIADIEAARQNADEAARAMENAAGLVTDDPELFARLSRAHAMANQPRQALLAIDKAVSLAPDSEPYHRARAQLATWSGEYAMATESLHILLDAHPDDAQLRLDLARVESWDGELDEAVEDFRVYLAQHPEDPAALLDLARVESWRGDYGAALEALGAYRDIAGETQEYKNGRARLLAQADRPEEALALTEPLLNTNPTDYQALYTQAIAFSQARRFSAVYNSLDALEEIKPGAADTSSLQRYLLTALKPRATLEGGVGSDSDGIDTAGVDLNGFYAIRPETYFRVGGGWKRMRADLPSGLAAVDGNETVQQSSGWVGLEGALAKNIWALGHIGYESSDADAGSMLLKAGLSYRPGDTLRLGLTSSHGLHDVSPRAVSLDIERTANLLHATWTPDLRHTLDADFSYDFFTDGNSSWYAGVSPRRTIMRSEWINLDLGISARWQGFDKGPGNGYYSPNFYQQYLAVGLIYLKFSEDAGLSLTVSPVIQKDDSIEDFQFSGNFAFEGTYGLYDDWMLKVRGNFIETTGIIARPYNRKDLLFSLTRRF